MPTVSELSEKEKEQYIAAARQRVSDFAIDAESDRMYETLCKKITKAAKLLKHKFGIRRVILFGSLAHRAWFSPESDVDLAVEGLSADNYWQAWQLAEEIIDDRPVSLIDIETASAPLLQAIERTGTEL